ncbi:hypothetical protein Taro_022227 [Colocasia esculenta]|uniref:Uncharacterized protein n=1 Tax=Colocasia esculenta TaxID=4460 RepID=A0A843VDV6_COLES|nr:hypothetical protein [Colocasia esculenta]
MWPSAVEGRRGRPVGFRVAKRAQLHPGKESLYVKFLSGVRLLHLRVEGGRLGEVVCGREGIIRSVKVNGTTIVY